MPVSTGFGAPRSLVFINRLLRDIFDPLTYGRIGYLLVALPLGIIEFTFLVTAISVGVGTAITLVGIPILIGTIYAWRWLAQFERRLIGALTGVQIPSPYRPDPSGAGWSRKVYARLADPATWKDLVFLLLQLPLGIVAFAAAAVVLGCAASWLAAPAYYWAVPDGVDLGLFQVDTLPGALAVVPLGALLAFVGIPALGLLGRYYGELGALLLGSNADPELTAQVSELEGARSRIIAAADAERRRIERDLHDGAQQRLVALSLTLRMAESRAQKDPEAQELIRSAGEEAGLALKELRDLARGIHPAILTNRGLAAALDDLAGRATVPVEVIESPRERLPDQVEAAAYFVVSECLANVGKHAQASSATVSVTAQDGQLLVEVRDDGTGGADVENGHGIQGLEDRVGALGGTLAIESPPGTGTGVLATIPLALPAEVDETWVPGRRGLLPDEDAVPVERRRRRRLRVRLGVVGVIALILVVVWALTGPDKPWIVWPLLGLGMVAALDAWFVLAGRRLRESDLDGVSGDRQRATRTLRRRRRLRLDAGALGIINLTLIGIWLAAGAGYFWPVWPILGCAAALALKSLRVGDVARERLIGDPSPR
ncbi:MAG: sensor domain-containing protein [Thermoleophilaceae bacterium]